MPKDLGKALGILASIAAIIGTCVAIIALIPAFGAWLSPREPISNTQSSPPIVNESAPTSIQSAPTQESSVLDGTNEVTPTLNTSMNNLKQLGFSGETISAIAGNSSDIYIGTTGFKHGIFHSSDSGKTWKAVNNGLGDLDVWNLVIDSAGNLYAGGSNGMWTSRDKGNSWLVCDNQMNIIDPPYTEIHASAINPLNDSIWAIVGSQISGGQFFAYSSDNCSTWIQPQGAYATFPYMPTKMFVTHNQPYWLYIIGIESSIPLLRTDNSGESWTEMATVGAAYDVLDMTGSWGNPLMLFAGTNMGIYRSDDGGYSWQPINNGLPNQGNELSVISVATNPQCNNCVLIATTNELFYSSDTGNTWSNISSIPNSMSITNVWADKSKPNVFYLGTTDGLWSLEIP